MTEKRVLVCDFPFHLFGDEPVVCWEISNLRTGLVNNDEIDRTGGRFVHHACLVCGSTIQVVLNGLEIKYNKVDPMFSRFDCRYSSVHLGRIWV